ncbi:hypothetical protein KAI92_05165 [Candidatus Parcubacteria bacterium]|nr:hypothetical protein [Candidatus Parcubacteria bacterium]
MGKRIFNNFSEMVNSINSEKENKIVDSNNTKFSMRKLLCVKYGVLVGVPKKSRYMKYMPENYNNGKVISSHWHCGKLFKPRTIINFDYYHIVRKNLGTMIVSTVKVFQDTTPDGERFISFDIYQTSKVDPVTILKFPENIGKGISIIGTNQEIEFRKRSIYERKEKI